MFVVTARFRGSMEARTGRARKASRADVRDSRFVIRMMEQTKSYYSRTGTISIACSGSRFHSSSLPGMNDGYAYAFDFFRCRCRLWSAVARSGY
jgi:hypothetical protein